MAFMTTNNNNASWIDDNRTSNFTLHVTNLPVDLDKDGVENMFLDYGTVTGTMVFKAKNHTNQAYISFSKYNEAESAISALNEKLPLMLNVRFKNDHKLERVINLSNPITDFRYTDSILDTTQGRKKVIDGGKIYCTSAFQQKHYTSEDELLYSVPNDTTTFDPYESPEPYHSTNLMYTRGTTHVSKDGRRHIAYGRGYTYYNLPEPHYDIEAYLQNVYEKREKELYEYAAKEFEDDDDNGFCDICCDPTPFRCQKCSITFYCSKPCQIKGWTKHKLECQPIPPLVKRLPKKPIQNGQTNDSNVKETEAKSSTQLRRPRVPVQTHVQQQQPLIATSLSHESNISRSKSPSLSMKSTDNRKKLDENRNNQNKTSITLNNFKAVATTFPMKHKPQKNKIEPNTIDDNIGFQSHTFIPKDKFVKVRITLALENGDYCVQKCDDDDAIEKLFLNLQNYVKTAKRVAPEENVKCILENDCMWYRATVVHLGKISKIFYHDWGTFDDLEVHEVCPINGFEDVPLFCRRIRLVEGTDNNCTCLTVDDEFFVKASNVLADGTIIVQALPVKKVHAPVETAKVTEKMANCSIKQTTQAKPVPQCTEFQQILDKIKSMPNVMDCLEAGDEGLLLLNKETKNEYSITLLPESQVENFERLVHGMKEQCDMLIKTNPSFRPNIGDLVCGSNEDGEWLRGIVLRTIPKIALAAIDESRVFDPVNCTSVPQDFINICTMGVIAKLLPNTRMPQPRPTDIEFIVDNISKDSAMITLKHAEINGKAVLCKWILQPEEKRILYAPLSNGNEVVLTHVSSQNSLYVRNMESSEKERVHKLDQNISKYALNRKPLTAPPVIGQIVLAHFLLDENYYRAIVTAIDGAKVIIKYIDFGNDEETNIDKLYDLPEDLKEQASGIRRIKLQGVPENVPLTQEAKEYFDQLIIEVAALKCNFTGDPLNEGVVLKTERNENVNDMVIAYLKPTWEREKQDDKKIYTLDDLPEAKLGDVGDHVEAVALCSYLHNGSLILGPNDIVACRAIEDMGQIINKYVEKTPEHYIPRTEELCIAKYSDQFYRALCLDCNATPKASRVFFIDYGNTEIVLHTDIRLFTEDFTTLAPYGIICSISSMVSNDKLTDKIFKRIDEIVNEQEIVRVNIMNIEPGCAANIDIDIPSVRVKLIEEGLL